MGRSRLVSALAASAVALIGIVPILASATPAYAASNTKVFWQGQYDLGGCPENNTNSCDLEVAVVTWADSYDVPSALSLVETNACIVNYTWSVYNATVWDSVGNYYLAVYVYVPAGGYQCAEGNATWRLTYDASITP
jgi:hypothetical protein